ncbi:hypothetical protein B7P43_G07157 [Cryptotermes secundus]|uniref:Uncharacterized protein n=1 Tax=Cryptotermes secundus TaxID=105785 RepID=A0A2J7PXK7_9NEOP|nr:hypothetical protein B7P43_G07157 [Cryptotermes secundus]
MKFGMYRPHKLFVSSTDIQTQFPSMSDRIDSRVHLYIKGRYFFLRVDSSGIFLITQYFSRNDRRTGFLNLFHGMLLHTKALQRLAVNVLTEDLCLTCVRSSC